MYDFGLYTQVSDSGPHGPLVFYSYSILLYLYSLSFHFIVHVLFPSVLEHLYLLIFYRRSEYDPASIWMNDRVEAEKGTSQAIFQTI